MASTNGEPDSAGRDKDLLRVESLTKYFPTRRRFSGRGRDYVRAVDGISFLLRHQETLGLVGESGCGKTTTARLVARLLEPTSGTVYFEGHDIGPLSGFALHRLRRQMQMVFQDPYSSLNPRMTVGEIVGEPLLVHSIGNSSERHERVATVLKVVGLDEHHIARYPHEFSGGQRQRIGVARALILRPKLIICDEPVSALDVSIQSQILNLLRDLQAEFGLSYLFIAHNLAVVKHMSDRIGVMYLGKLVEIAAAKDLYRYPTHPYTKALLSAIPALDPELRRDRILLEGDVPNPMDPPHGCRFHPRCRDAVDDCRFSEPSLRETGTDHFVACHAVER